MLNILIVFSDKISRYNSKQTRS